MADENIREEEATKYSAEEAIKQLWRRSKQKFVQKDGTNLPTASENQLGGIRIGAGLAIDENGAVSVESAGEVQWADVKGKPDTLEGYGIRDAATKAELEAVEQKVTRMYERKGSLDTVADLDNIQNPEYGWTYNIRENGHNYAWTEGEPDFWDDLGGTFTIEELTAHDIDVITGFADDEETFDEILSEGGEIELGDDMTLSGQKVITKNVTIDLGGNKLTSSVANGYGLIADGCVLTLKGEGTYEAAFSLAAATNGGEVIIESGLYKAPDVGFAATGTGSKITMNGGRLEIGDGGIGAFRGGEIEVNGGEIEVADNFCLFTNGRAELGGNKITLNGGTLTGKIRTAGYEAIGIYIANNDVFVMNGGDVLAENGCGLCMRAGQVTIHGGRIACTGEAGTTGKIADSPIPMSKSAVIYHESANYPNKAGMKLVIDGGEFVGVDHAVEVLSNETVPQVFVTGGTFTPDYPEE